MLEDVEAAFTLLETTPLKKSDELNDACQGFFEKLKVYLKEKDTESFYSKEIRSAFRLTPSSIGRYLYELNPQVTAKEMTATTNLSRRGVEYQLDRLKKSGKIERIGSTKNGCWIIQGQ